MHDRSKLIYHFTFPIRHNILRSTHVTLLFYSLHKQTTVQISYH